MNIYIFSSNVDGVALTRANNEYDARAWLRHMLSISEYELVVQNNNPTVILSLDDPFDSEESDFLGFFVKGDNLEWRAK